jgi:hypothetical protein
VSFSQPDCIDTKERKEMLNRLGSNASDAPEKPASDALEGAVPPDFNHLSDDEIEHLLALCKAPARLWQREHEAAPARAPEPFGMIA